MTTATSRFPTTEPIIIELDRQGTAPLAQQRQKLDGGGGSGMLGKLLFLALLVGGGYAAYRYYKKQQGGGGAATADAVLSDDRTPLVPLQPPANSTAACSGGRSSAAVSEHFVQVAMATGSAAAAAAYMAHSSRRHLGQDARIALVAGSTAAANMAAHGWAGDTQSYQEVLLTATFAGLVHHAFESRIDPLHGAAARAVAVGFATTAHTLMLEGLKAKGAE